MGVILLLAAGAGCPTKPVATQREYEGVMLTIACPEGPAASLVARYGKVWSLQTGARLEMRLFDPPAGMAADGWLIAPPELARWAAAGQLLPVPEALRASEHAYAWRDLLGLDRNKLLIWDHTVYALPFLGDAPLCYYRDDLFRDPAHQEGFRAKYGRPLAAPATWDEWADIAEYFNGKARPDAQAPFPSLPPLPATDAGLDREFFCVAAPMDRRVVGEDDRHPPPDDELFSFHFDLKTGRPRLDQSAFVAALGLLRRLQACRPPTASPQPAEAFRDGQAVLCLAGSKWVARFQDEGSRVRGRFGVCQVPGSRRVFAYETGEPGPAAGDNRVPYLGTSGWLAVVPKYAAHPEAAFALFAELSGPRTSAEILLDPAWGAGVFRRDHYRLLTGGIAFGLKPRWTQALEESLRQTLSPALVNPVLCLRTPDQQEYRRALAEELRSALGRRDADPKQALGAVVRRWQELNTAKGAAPALAAYRVSLGLPAER